jgi:excisionase family DNA binding protein
MTASEAAREIGCSVQTVREWADAGRLASVRTVSGWRIFDPADVRRVAAERRRELKRR